MNYPKIFLAIDNCIASKRWTNPVEWMNIIQSLGVSHIEAGADNECDALYMGKHYLQGRAAAVNIGREKYAVQFANLYSGHGSYATLGLAHTVIRNRKRILNLWLKPRVELSSTLKAGFGFFATLFRRQFFRMGWHIARLSRTCMTILWKNVVSLAVYGLTKQVRHHSGGKCDQCFSRNKRARSRCEFAQAL